MAMLLLADGLWNVHGTILHQVDDEGWKISDGRREVIAHHGDMEGTHSYKLLCRAMICLVCTIEMFVLLHKRHVMMMMMVIYYIVT